MMADIDRMRLELQIVGSVILNGSLYPRLSDFVSAKNFTDWPNADLRKVWQAISEIHPDPIEWVTITEKLRASHGKPMYKLLMTCTNYATWRNLEYLALILVQDCIANTLFSTLADLASGEPDQKVVAALHELGEELKNNSLDPLYVLEIAPDFVASVGAERDVVEALQEIEKGFKLKAAQITARARFKQALGSMSNYTNEFLTGWPEWRANTLVQICEKVINEEPLHPGFDEALKTLTQNCTWQA